MFRLAISGNVCAQFGDQVDVLLLRFFRTYSGKFFPRFVLRRADKIKESGFLAADVTDFINGGRVDYPDVVKKVYDDTNKTFSTNVPAPNQ